MSRQDVQPEWVDTRHPLKLVHNRRTHYILHTQEYLGLSYHQEKEPALYDSHIRRFQTNDEKLRDVQGRGFAERLEQGMLLWQDRARQRETQTGPTQEQDAPPSPCSSYTLGRSTRPSRPGSAEPETRPAVECPDDTPDRPSFMWLEPEEELRSPATSREDGILKWTALLRKKFILGEDDEFDYSTVDDNEKYDVHLKQEREEAWFDDEPPTFVFDGNDDEVDSAGVDGTQPRTLTGETGIQDF